MITYDSARTIRKLHSAGVSVKEIAKKLEISQPTVRAYIRDEQRGIKRSVVARPNRRTLLELANQEVLFEVYKDSTYNCETVTKKLNDDPCYFGLPASFKIAPRTVRSYISKHAPKPTFARPEPQYFESDIGQQLQIDFTYAKYKFKNDLRERLIYIFEAVYPWSHQTYFKIFPDLSQASWLRGISGCIFKYGAPREILCDNDKSLVTSHSKAGFVKYNREFRWFCEQFEITPIACKPGRPQTKGMVERAGRYLKGTGLGWVKVFHPEVSNIEELDAAIQIWNDKVASVDRTFDAYLGEQKLEKYQVCKLYEIERKHLGIINPSFDLYISVKMVKVNKRGYVHIHGCTIPLPIDYAKSDVCVMVGAKGDYLITNLDGIQLSEGVIPERNLITYKFDDAAEDIDQEEVVKKQRSKSKPLSTQSTVPESSDSVDSDEMQGYRLFYKEPEWENL